MDYRNQSPFTATAREAAEPIDAGLRAYMLHIYNLMASALVLTGISAYTAANWAPLRDSLYVIQNGQLTLSGLGWLIFFAPLAFVLVLGAGLQRMSLGAAQAAFWGFSVVMGLSLSSIFFAYTGKSITQVFFITAILFGSMSLWGYTSKKDLTSMGHFVMMGLWGIIIASLVNFFLHSSGLQFAISVVGVLVFTGLTAYDTQKIKVMYYQLAGNAEMASKFAIMGALELYLDFINLFVMLMRLFGDRRN